MALGLSPHGPPKWPPDLTHGARTTIIDGLNKLIEGRFYLGHNYRSAAGLERRRSKGQTVPKLSVKKDWFTG